MTDDATRPDGEGDGELGLSPVRGDALYRAQRAIGLIPEGGLGLGRRSRTILVGKRALLVVLAPAALPLVAVFAIEVPVKELLLELLTTLA